MSFRFDQLSAELQYVLLLFLLFFLPQFLQRFRLPAAISCVGLGAAAGMGFGVLRDDATVNLLSTFGIVSLFLFAGLDVDFRELRRNKGILGQHLLIGVALLVVMTLLVERVFGLPFQQAVLVGLALTTPSTGFILDSLDSLGVEVGERSWIKSKAIATELLALVLLFIALQPASVLEIALSMVVLAAMVVFLPFVFRLFAAVFPKSASKSEFAFLVMMAVMCALITRQLGAYYLVGAFVVGITAQRFRLKMPGMASEKTLHAVEVFASFFVPFYFFHAGLNLQAEDFSAEAVLLGLLLVALLVPLRVYVVALHRRLALGEPVRTGARIGLAISPTLIFTVVIAEILHDRFGLGQPLFGGLIVFTLVNTVIPGLILRVPPLELEELHAPPVAPAGVDPLAVDPPRRPPEA